MRNLQGFFFYISMTYNKKPECLEKCYEILLKRVLQINDKEKTITYLKHLGYFRLTGYMFHLQSKYGLHYYIYGSKFVGLVTTKLGSIL